MSKPIRAIRIDAANRQITEIVVTGLKHAQEIVGGYIEIGARFDATNEMYVNEEGRLKPSDSGFKVAGTRFHFVGNGVVIGGDDDTGEWVDCTLSVDTLRAKIEWVDLSGVAHLVPAPRIVFTRRFVMINTAATMHLPYGQDHALHVHVPGCTEIGRYGPNPGYIVESESAAVAAVAHFSDLIDEGSMSADDVIGETRFFPCCGGGACPGGDV